MTPKPANLPPMDRMTHEQIIAEAARVLGNSCSDYSMQLANRLERMIDKTISNT